MAQQNNLLASLREAVTVYDDNAFIAMANRGLFRRACKDLETAVITMYNDANEVNINADDAVVTLALPLPSSRCTCPASGICRHILMSLMWLKQSAPIIDIPTKSPLPGDEICVLTDEALQKWAGKPLIRKATQRLAQGIDVTWEDGQTLDFTFNNLEIICRWMPGQGIAGMVCECHTPYCCEHRVMAILAYQASHGLREITMETVEISQQILDNRADVLAATGDIICDLVGHGISHLSESVSERIFTLSISAHIVEMPRMERMLKSLAAEIELQLTRDARANISNILTAAAQIEALRLALRNPTPALSGQHRSEYHDVKQLNLLGIGASKWLTKSGFTGLTLYFWNIENSQWMTWSDSRSAKSTDNFSPEKRFIQPGPWQECSSPAATIGKQVILHKAKRNASGRISGRQETIAEVKNANSLLGPTPIDTWDVVSKKAISLFSSGFQDWDERDTLIFAEPEKWDSALFDAIRQELQLSLLDKNGRRLHIIVPYSEETKNVISILEEFKAKPKDSILGTLQFREGRIYLVPLVIFHNKKVINLTLEQPSKESELIKQIKQIFNNPKQSPVKVKAIRSVSAFLTSAISEIEIIAECGATANYDLTQLKEMAINCKTVGLTDVAGKIENLFMAIETNRHSTSPNYKEVARHILHCYFVLHQSLVIDTLLQATAGLR